MDSCNKSTRDSSPFDCLLFDLDETLYSAKIGIGEATKRNIDDFLVQECGFPETQTKILRVELFKTYGSSLAGLRALGYDIDADDYHSFVHGRLPYDSIKPDAQLRNLLRTINQRKIIFTNSDRIHATKALDRLGIRDCFEQIICFETMNPNLAKSTRPDEFPVVLKPSLDAFRIAIDVAEIDPRRTLFLDDSVRKCGRRQGCGSPNGSGKFEKEKKKNVVSVHRHRTVYGSASSYILPRVGKSIKIKEADFVLETVNSLAQAIPEIWLGEGQRMTRTRSQMDPILATAPIGA
ncbi:haloacid dehalogenase-like hydrolase (HAD) superfamily protein [Actinidia rufa]|uniref:Haloacid dehalogenase-like hydrolase (HAD) superfamily protein n=1 Tax=Actinidia rufa TaxID=165716 RepID=A0A7J0HG05_9ERIC|nr:haloacid dehalogenase-like hydrolase (HAD) superfamily protein [Actinidia rufa]